MYAAFAVGAPAGTVLYAGYGFAAIAVATTLIPLFTLLLGSEFFRVAAGVLRAGGFQRQFQEFCADALYLGGTESARWVLPFSSVQT